MFIETIKIFGCFISKTRIIMQYIRSAIQFLIIKHNHILKNLFLLWISKISKECLEDLNDLIKSKYLRNYYCIKYVKDDLYLWW